MDSIYGILLFIFIVLTLVCYSCLVVGARYNEKCEKYNREYLKQLQEKAQNEDQTKTRR